MFLYNKLNNFLDYPTWNYDGSSTNQSTGHNSDIYLNPVASCPDPFLSGNNRLVLCDTYKEKQPTGIKALCFLIIFRIYFK